MNSTITTSPIIALPPVIDFQIVEHSETITDGYLYRRDVQPVLTQNQEGVYLLSIHRQGEYGNFEVPYVSSQVVYANSDLVVILISYCGNETFGRKKNLRVTKGQFWRYVQRDDSGVWNRVEWRHLHDTLRRDILAAYQEQAPAWAKAPGKLEADYSTPKHRQTKTTSYKLVRVVDGRYYSVYKPDEEYVIGTLKRQRAKKHHGGGYYSYPKMERLLEMFREQKLFPYRNYREPMTLALLECEIGGRVIEYSSGKWSSTFLRPLSIISTIEYAPN